MVPLPDLPGGARELPLEVWGLKGSVLRLILRDWLRPAKVSFLAVPNAERLTEANRLLSDENVFVPALEVGVPES